VEGQLTYAGKPLANRTLLLEGKKESTWPAWATFIKATEKVKTVAITDEKGSFQVVDLPAGEYTLKLVLVGKEPVALTMFKLARDYKDINTKFEIKESVKLEEQLKTDVLRHGESHQSK